MQVKMNVIPIFIFVLEILVDRLQQNYLNKCTNCVCCVVVKRTQLYVFIWKKPFRTYLKSSFTAKEQCINFCFSTQWEFLDQLLRMKKKKYIQVRKFIKKTKGYLSFAVRYA